MVRVCQKFVDFFDKNIFFIKCCDYFLGNSNEKKIFDGYWERDVSIKCLSFGMLGCLIFRSILAQLDFKRNQSQFKHPLVLTYQLPVILISNHVLAISITPVLANQLSSLYQNPSLDLCPIFYYIVKPIAFAENQVCQSLKII